VEYLSKLKWKEVTSIIGIRKSWGNSDQFGRYWYVSRTVEPTIEKQHYITRGKYKILLGYAYLMYCEVSVKALKHWGWKKYKL